MKNSVLLVVFLSLCISSIVHAAGGLLPGNGTEADPFLIEDLADFDTFATEANADLYWSEGIYTKLMCNIDLGGRVYDKAVISPDTNHALASFYDGTEFSGYFDGNNHSISKLTINAQGNRRDYVGLFGKVGTSGTITSLGVTEVKISNIDSFSNVMGSVCGDFRGIASKCFTSGIISLDFDARNVGGFCGMNSGMIMNCYSKTDISVGMRSSYVAGFCGSHHGNSSSISKCYSIGNVVALSSRSVGGFCAYGDNLFLGGISGCFWDIESCGINLSLSQGGSGRTKAEMQDVSTFLNAGWEFVELAKPNLVSVPGTWQMPANDYPRLAWESLAAMLIMNNVVNESESEAETIISNAGLVIGDINYEYNSTIAKDCVISQIPEAGTLVEAGSEIDLVVSLGALSVDDGININELALLSQFWLQSDCVSGTPCKLVDYYIDGRIDLLDFKQLAISWLNDKITYFDTWEGFLDDFSSDLGDAWETSSTPNGRIAIVDGKLRMDCLSNIMYALNVAVLHINLEGRENVMLSFWHRESGDELHELPATFTGSIWGDGIAVSVDGENWTTIFSASDLDVGSEGKVITFDLGSLGIEYTSDFQIKFQKTSKYPWSSNGCEWDDISLRVE